MSLKRSTINRSISRAIDVIEHFGFTLPQFGYWNTLDWDNASDDYNEIRDCLLGWDVTDFGSNDFKHIGRTLFTLRNGRKGIDGYPKEYAEKLLIDPEGQRAPAHYHLSKREDLICIAGGNILVQLQKSDADGNPSSETFTVQVDGCTKRLAPRDIIRLRPGMSVCVPPKTIHQFWGEEGTGASFDGIGYTLSGEVSSVCDDFNDNVFLVDYAVRFPEVEEDEVKAYYLCHEYPKNDNYEKS